MMRPGHRELMSASYGCSDEPTKSQHGGIVNRSLGGGSRENALMVKSVDRLGYLFE